MERLHSDVSRLSDLPLSRRYHHGLLYCLASRPGHHEAITLPPRPSPVHHPLPARSGRAQLPLLPSPHHALLPSAPPPPHLLPPPRHPPPHLPTLPPHP